MSSFFCYTDFDGLFISNGPGDPSVCSKTVEHIRQYIESGNLAKPVFGICLGHQLVCRALGTPTFKMKLVFTRILAYPTHTVSCIDIILCRGDLSYCEVIGY